MGKHIWIKPKQLTFLNFTVHVYTAISPHNHLWGLQTFTDVQAILLHPPQQSSASWLQNHNLTTVLTSMSSKMILQTGKQMKIWWHQVGAIWWVIQDSENVTNLYGRSHNGVQSSNVMLKNRMFHVMVNSLFSSFSVSQYCWELLLVPVGTHVECIMPRMAQKTVDMHKHSTITMCSPVLNSNGYTFLSLKNRHSRMNVSQRHVFCSKELYHCTLSHAHWHTCLTLHNVYDNNSQPCSGRILKYGTVCSKV